MQQYWTNLNIAQVWKLKYMVYIIGMGYQWDRYKLCFRVQLKLYKWKILKVQQSELNLMNVKCKSHYATTTYTILNMIELLFFNYTLHFCDRVGHWLQLCRPPHAWIIVMSSRVPFHMFLLFCFAMVNSRLPVFIKK